MSKIPTDFILRPITPEPYGSIEGPWNIGDPVHEVLTLLALDETIKNFDASLPPLIAGIPQGLLSLNSASDHNIYPERMDSSVMQFLRGVIWPDDPRGYLFDDDSNLDYSTGIRWYYEFLYGSICDYENLIARSHRGNLQFFHSMAVQKDDLPNETKKQILDWMTFCIEVLRNNISPNLRIMSHPLLNRLFPGHRNITIKQLMLSEQISDLGFQQRICGILLHLIQDSYFYGHVSRNDEGKIHQFLVYQLQDSDKHSKYDKWWGGNTLGERINNTPGAKEAFKYSVEVLKRVLGEESLESVFDYIDGVVLNLAHNAIKAGSGNNFV